MHFLDTIAAKGDRVLTAAPKGEIDTTGWTAFEIDYLINVKDYTWVNQWALVPKSTA